MAEWTVDRKDVTSTVDGNYMLYRNRPLVREDNIICYGNLSDPYVIQMIVMTEKEFRGKKVPDQIYVQLLSTDTSKPLPSVVGYAGDEQFHAIVRLTGSARRRPWARFRTRGSPS